MYVCVSDTLTLYTASSIIQSFSKGEMSRYAAMLEIVNGRLAVIITIIYKQICEVANYYLRLILMYS